MREADDPKETSVRTIPERGIALITVMLIMILISAMVVGMSWMVMTDQRLGGNNNNREIAFYGAEAGMEKLTADLGNEFATQGSISAANLTSITSGAAPLGPPSIQGITYQNSAGGSTYLIECGSPLASPCTPAASNATILPPSSYSGMQGLITSLTLSVAAQDLGGSEVKLHRQVQLVAIPVFQFGIYSDSDLAFFNGPEFNFGGRVHTNGNLWLSPNAGPTLINDKVTVVGQVIRTNLENGWPGSGNTITSGDSYAGIVSISTIENTSTAATSPNYNNSPWLPLGLNQGSVTGYSVYGNVSTTANSSWPTIVNSYNGELENGVPPLSLTSTALGGISSPIELIERPVPNEATTNPAEFSQQYFSQATMRILLDDYPSGTNPGTPNGCHASDMMSLNGIDTTSDPVDLYNLATNTGAIASVAPTWTWSSYSSQTFYPLPGSDAGATYSSGNGYWQTAGTGIITGCIKIEYQDTSNNWHDITKKILGLGYTGRNIYPQGACTPPRHGSCTNSVAPNLYGALPANGTVVNAQGPTVNTGVTTVGCTDPSPSPTAIIRLARLRDNPTNATSGGCGSATQNSYDYWPMALFDTREAEYREGLGATWAANADGNPPLPAQGVMYYIELDAGDLATWFKNNQSSLALLNSTGFSLYFSDRRGEQKDTTQSPAVKTGAFGYNDFVNPNDVTNGCPDGALNQGEDLQGDGVFRNYGGAEMAPYNAFTSGTEYWTGTTMTGALVANPSCSSPAVWPGLVYAHSQEARENPPVFFRRALKIVDGATLNLGTSCYGTSPNPPCGLTIASENPAYIQGDYNAPGGNMAAAGTVAASVDADSVTVLSDSWNDINSFISPYVDSNRPAVTTSYRVAVIGGKGIPFPEIGSTQDFGTDGGVHNFLRYIENWGSANLNYEGSLVSFYYSLQGTGTYKCCGDVYDPPNRVYNFDTNFTNGPQWLPPITPVLRSINTIGFSQEIMPTQ
jgi:hypothetical protein